MIPGMKYKTLLILFILILSQKANSQDFKFGFQTGIGTYSMNGLKNLVNDAPDNLSFDSKVVSDFPPYIYYRPSAILKFSNFALGLVYSFQSTGARVSARDYSGDYRYDMKVLSKAPGIYSEIRLADEKLYTISLHSIIGMAFSKLETRQYLNVFNSMVTNLNYNFKSLNYFVEPGIDFTHPFKSLSLGINVGYMIQFGKQAFYEGTDKKNTLYDFVNQVSVKPNWNGIRVGLTIAYTI
jgi:hypothetical protein